MRYSRDVARCDVLVVDDNRELVEALCIWLRRLGKRVDSAHCGEDALAKIGTLRPTIALIDLTLPGLSGWEVARRTRALGLAQLPRLIAMTGLDDPVFQRRSLAAGFVKHLLKPLDERRLRDAIS
jgi:CheY-like chemotaxis protein